MRIHVVDRAEHAIGWIASDPDYMQRASHALRAREGVWLVDPVDGPGLDVELAALGPVVGVIRLIDRHGRDADALAERHGVELHDVPRGSVPGAPFEIVVVMDRRFWRESALWWPEHGLLLVAEALGSAPYFRAGDRRFGVHPTLRLTPPRALRGFPVRELRFGHGAGFTGQGLGAEVDERIDGARRAIPRWLAGLPRARRQARLELAQLAELET